MKILLCNLHLHPLRSIKITHLHIERRHFLYTVVYLAYDLQSEYNVLLLL